MPVVEHGYSEEYPAGLVMEQSVDYGKRLRRGEEVLVTVSDGSQWVYFDDMTGWTLEQVDERLTQLGFSSEHVSVTYIVSDQPIGCVAGQSPAEGWITRETEVNFLVSAEAVTVPTLTGLTTEGAQALAAAEGARHRRHTRGLLRGHAGGHGHRAVRGRWRDRGRGHADHAHREPAAADAVLSRVELRHRRAARGCGGAPGADHALGLHVYGLQRHTRYRTYSVELSSAEQGVHTLREYMDGVLMAETQVMFE